jgi:DNA adenine methylase
MSRHKTPLRYPGGKQKLYPFIFEVISENDFKNFDYIEPYAGGAGVAIELLLNGYVKTIHLNDSAFPVYAFWEAVKTEPEKLCNLISRASLSVEEWKKRREIVRNHENFDILEVGFSTFYLNRCNRSGVLSGGIIGGLSQDGKWKMDARFSRNDLIRRIEMIAAKRENLEVYNLDAEKFIVEQISQLPINSLIYCDPPYFEKGGNLYLNAYKPADHTRISNIIQNNIQQKWLVSYDYQPEILRNYANRRHFAYLLKYNAARVYEGKELFIFSDDLEIPKKSSLKFIDDAINPKKR